ncbi:MAG: thioredoxin domain-containing protein [Terriglobia bacterium]
MILVLAALLAAGIRPEIVEGNPVSAVRVIIYEDLQCSDCQRLRTLLDEKILPRYGSRVAFVHRDFPLPKHDWARVAAAASRWVYEHDPRIGITLRRELLAEQQTITQASLKSWLAEFASRNKLDPEGIVAAMDDKRLLGLVEQDFQGALGRGIAKVPTIFAGGQSIAETITYEDFARLLDNQLKQ